MTYANPSFSPSEFELRNSSNSYLSPEQTEQVNLAKSRVNGQLDFLAQMLGWNGDDYWGNLPSTVSQKRQLLGGSFGVYNSYIYPRIISVKTWNDINDFTSPRVAIVEVERNKEIEAGQIAYLGINTYPILSLTETEESMTLNFGEVDDNFFAEVNNNTQLRIDSPQSRPAPFLRPNIGVAGDCSFVCKDNNGSLTLYPSYDTNGLFPYLFPVIFAGATYSFDKPVYVSYDDTLAVDIAPVYNEEIGLWVLSIPKALKENSPGIVITLVWSYANNNLPSNSTLKVKVQDWVDPSDWKGPNVLQNFLGAWGNKGGSLPFNLAFDSLSLHGFDEKNSLYLPVVERALEFNNIVNLVYAQRARIDSGIPGNLPPGQLWWNTSTGKLAIQVDQEEGCPVWVEAVYREAPEQELAPEIVFPDVASFEAAQSLVPPSTISVAIADITGLSPTSNVLGINQTFTDAGVLYIYKQPDTEYWVPLRFEFLTVSLFQAASEQIPYNVPTYISNSTGLSPSGSNYSIVNLETTITGKYKTVLVKENSPSEWTLFPDSILKFIANSTLFNGPLEGEMWWDYSKANPDQRSAKIYYNSAWVALNTNVAVGAPPANLDFDTILFYCDGVLMAEGETCLTDNFSLTFTTDAGTGLYSFLYQPTTLLGRTKFPLIEISDSLTSSYRMDITDLLFSGMTYRMTPNVYDAEAPLRLWKTEHLQVANSSELLDRQTYVNPLVADLNNGPANENWQRYFVRLPLDYGRNEAEWQKTALICEDFAYYGSNIEPEAMNCPPAASRPQIYEEVFLNNDRNDYTYVYSEPYLYSAVVYDDFSSVDASYTNCAVRPIIEDIYDEFEEAEFIDYDPLHNRLVDFSPENYGNWKGVYLNISACNFLSGYYINDLLDASVEPIAAPIWDASIYKYPPTCDNSAKTYSVDANSYKICYAYFVADASAAEDGFFDPQEESAWRFTRCEFKNLYMLPERPSSSCPVEAKEFTLTPPVLTFNTVVTPSSEVVETTFALEVTTTNVPNGTLLPFTVSGSGYLLTTSGQVEIQNNFGSAPINTGYPDIVESPLKDVPPGDLCTATLGGIATGLPGTSASFTITLPPPPTFNYQITLQEPEVDGQINTDIPFLGLRSWGIVLNEASDPLLPGDAFLFTLTLTGTGGTMFYDYYPDVNFEKLPNDPTPVADLKGLKVRANHPDIYIGSPWEPIWSPFQSSPNPLLVSTPQQQLDQIYKFVGVVYNKGLAAVVPGTSVGRLTIVGVPPSAQTADSPLPMVGASCGIELTQTTQSEYNAAVALISQAPPFPYWYPAEVPFATVVGNSTSSALTIDCERMQPGDFSFPYVQPSASAGYPPTPQVLQNAIEGGYYTNISRGPTSVGGPYYYAWAQGATGPLSPGGPQGCDENCVHTSLNWIDWYSFPVPFPHDFYCYQGYQGGYLWCLARPGMIGGGSPLNPDSGLVPVIWRDWDVPLPW